MKYNNNREKRQLEIKRQIRELQAEIQRLARELDPNDELRLQVYNMISNSVQAVTHKNELELYRNLTKQVVGWKDETLKLYISQGGMLEKSVEDTINEIIRVEEAINYFEEYGPIIVERAEHLLLLIKMKPITVEKLLRIKQLIVKYNEHTPQEMVTVLDLCIEIVEGEE